MNSLKITLQRQEGERWPVVLEYQQQDSPWVRRVTGWLLLDVQALTEASTALAYGRILGEALFAVSIREAMACETPVIGSDSGEIPYVIGDGGLAFPEGNAGELATRIRQLLDDPILYARLAQTGRQRVLDNDTQERIARQTYEVYQEMLGQRVTGEAVR